MKYPDFIIGGERRSGSTSLYEILKRHPQIGMHPISDLDYFIDYDLFSRTNPQLKEEQWDEEAQMAKYRQEFEGLNGVVGQKDADLLWWKPAHERLAKNLPTTKFIFILRNPVKRAESQYWNEFQKGREKKSFTEALQREENKQLSKWETLHLQYKQRGRYLESLQHFLQFIPQERVLVVVLENLISNWDKEIQVICDFLGIEKQDKSVLQLVHTNKEPVMVIDPKYQNTLMEKAIQFYDRYADGIIRRVAKSKEHKNQLRTKWKSFGKVSARETFATPKSTLDDLYDYYQPFNEQLADFFNLDVSKWNKKN